MSHAAGLLTIQLLAFWPVWQWYFSRLSDSPDERWGLLALTTAVISLFSKEPKTNRVADRLLVAPALLILLYAITFPFLPPLARAGIAFTALGVTFTSLRFGPMFQPGMFGLLYLSLPILPSLQFYGGYPLRMLVAGAAAHILRFEGFGVVQQGVCLDLGGHQVWIDAPCSGIRMLWVGLYLACTLTCMFKLRVWKSLAVVLIAFPVIIAGNVFRAVALFYTEAGIVKAPGWIHEYTGAVAFALAAVSLLWLARLLRRTEVCPKPGSI
jgi:exosortase/archaeosortase family protein